MITKMKKIKQHILYINGQMEIYIKENGKIIILKDMEYIIYQMEINMKENGKKIIKMV